MSNKDIKNITHSVAERLKSIAKKQNREHQDLILAYLIERFLYRISHTKYAEEFILKGALMLQILGEQCMRATRDIDFMAQADFSLEKCKEIVVEIIACDVPDDGVIFDANTIKVAEIQKDTRQRGVRASFIGKIGTARATLQLDIGPYYKVIPSPIAFEFPQLLNFGSPSLLGYSAESIIADKFEAMISRDDTNTRLKDFFDIWVLSTVRYFDLLSLKEAIEEVFGYYETPIPKETPACFSEEFYSNKAKLSQWKNFLKNAALDASHDFSEVNQKVQDFLMPVCDAINLSREGDLYWLPDKGWQAKPVS